MEIYSGIYDIVSENLNNAGVEFEYRKSTFLKEAGSHPTEICVRDYLELSNEEFMEAMYQAAMKRLPEEKVRRFWRAKYDLGREAFQEMFLRFLARSSVVAINRITFVDNPYFVQRKGLKYRAMGALYGLTDKSNLREFGKKLPAPIQKIIRKVFL